jgi:diaminohydroxyphosphoribosylaminopyrimidine deaminase/5-amino-6-(5-phosphoribosylamino)uracil reductase
MTMPGEGFMAQAIRLAERGRFTTDPNPRVGCVIVQGRAVVGEGWHRCAGGPHAERIALAEAGARARGADVFVTLEPCAHHGRTPPCADALIEAGVARVVAAMVDPDPRVTGRGLERLRSAGIVVEVGLLAEQAAGLNPGFVKRQCEGLPYCRVKLAASLDGRTAMASGESRWITSDASRTDVQRLRAASSAIVTGCGTVLADDPSLNVRLEAAALGLSADEPVRQPLRVVVDSRLETPPTARLLRLPGATLLTCTRPDSARRTALEAAGAEILVCPPAAVIGAESQDRVDLRALFSELARRGINEVLIEAGPTLAGAAVQAGLVDELILYVAPHLMGSAARGLFELPGLHRMSERIPLAIVDARRVGPDLRITARHRR